MLDFRKTAKAEHQRIREMLSVYIDEELSSEDRARVAEHLARCADCAWELETLRQTVNLVRQLPKVPVPRAFTIHEMPQPRQAGLFQARWAYTYLKGATALAAILLTLVLAGDVLLQFQQATTGLAPAKELAAPTVIARQEAPPTPVELPGLAEKRSAEGYAGATASPPTAEEGRAFVLMPTPTAPTPMDYGLAAGATATPLAMPVPLVGKAEVTRAPLPFAAVEATAEEAPMLAAVPTAPPQMTTLAPPAAPVPASAAPAATATAMATPVLTATPLRVAKAPAEVLPTEESALSGQPTGSHAPRLTLLRVVEASLCLLVMALIAATLIVGRTQRNFR